MIIRLHRPARFFTHRLSALTFLPWAALTATIPVNGLAPLLAAEAAADARPEPATANGEMFELLLDAVDTSAAPVVAAAAARLPALLMKVAEVDAALAQSTFATSALLPRLSLEAVGAQSLSRDFGGRSTFAERLIPMGRADAVFSVEQMVFDFGATMARARAGREGVEAARAELAAAREQAALLLIGAWAGAAAAQLEADASRAHARRTDALVADAAQRFERGIDGGPTLARVKAYAAEAAMAQIMAQRRRAEAEAQFQLLFGDLPHSLRWPAIPVVPLGVEEQGPRVAAARARLRAARAGRQAAARERLPQISTRLNGALYNVLGSGFPDHDVRGQLVIRQGLSLGGAERAREREAQAREHAAEQDLARAEAEERRDRSVAASDVTLLADARAEAKRRYDESRHGRDMVALQARMLRAALPEVLRAEQELAAAVTALIRMRENEIVARAQQLASAGRLADALNVEPIE
jgi:outer membrane protein, adhesin transport system